MEKDPQKSSQPRFVRDLFTEMSTEVEGLDHLWLDGRFLRGRTSELQKRDVMKHLVRKIHEKVRRDERLVGYKAFRGRRRQVPRVAP